MSEANTYDYKIEAVEFIIRDAFISYFSFTFPPSWAHAIKGTILVMAIFCFLAVMFALLALVHIYINQIQISNPPVSINLYALHIYQMLVIIWRWLI